MKKKEYIRNHKLKIEEKNKLFLHEKENFLE
jgi:hypothetical protein